MKIGDTSFASIINSRKRHSASLPWLALYSLALVLPVCGVFSAETPHSHQAVAIAPLVIAPDRGFMGNEEVREALESFAQGKNGEIVFVTDERTRETLNRAMQRLSDAGARQVVALPLFLSDSDPKWSLAKKLLAELPKGGEASPAASPSAPAVSLGRLFGQSYFAVEVLADRLRAIENPAGRDVIVVGYGAKDAESREQMETDWQRLVDLAAKDFGFKSARAVVWYDPSVKDRQQETERVLTETAKGGERVAVVPFHFGKKLDDMMTFTASLRSKLPQGAELIGGEVTPHPAVATWMAREWNRQVPMRAEDLGVVFLAHGSDYHWNETMREAVAPLTEQYKMEFAFCMADPPLVERAVRRLEERGARAIVIVRVFGLAASFKPDVERMIGLDVEKALGHEQPEAHSHVSHDDHSAHAAHGHGGHHGHAAGPPGPRIRSAALLTTVGGLEDHRYFAEALLDRAKSLSKEPKNETVFLVAHGAGDDPNNDHWRRLLESLAGQMRANGGAAFRAIQTGTWREDWPDKRAPELAALREKVEEASRDGGRAIVIPARTAAQGEEKGFLKGLAFELGNGFAPHPLFARWIEERIQAGAVALGVGKMSPGLESHAAAAAAEAVKSRSQSSQPARVASGEHHHQH